MASPLCIKRFLILGMLAVFLSLSFASAHYTYAGDDDDRDTEPAEGGYGNKDGSRGEYGKSPMMDDDEEEEKNYRKPVPKKSDHDKGGYDKPVHDKGDSDKPEKDEDDNDDDDDDDDGKYDHGSGYGKSEHDDNDDDEEDDDDEPRGAYDSSYGKPKNDKNDEENKYGKYEPMNVDDGKQYKGKGPRKDDKRHPHRGYDEPKEGPRGDHKQPKPAPYTPTKVVPKSISVEGVVSCQDCKYVGGDSLTGAKPIAGAKVKLVCQTGPRYKSFFYAMATPDKNGYLLISVPQFDFKKFTPVDNCAVFLVSSPLKECGIAMNINMGKTGGPLRPIPTFAPSENLMYSVGPFAFAPTQCSPKPPAGYIPPPASVSPPPAYGSGSHY